MEILFGILLGVFVINQIAWLVFVIHLLKRNQHERWELQERIKSPDIPLPPPSAFEQAKSASVEEIENKPVDEFDLVGKVNPPTPLRED